MKNSHWIKVNNKAPTEAAQSPTFKNIFIVLYCYLYDDIHSDGQSWLHFVIYEKVVQFSKNLIRHGNNQSQQPLINKCFCTVIFIFVIYGRRYLELGEDWGKHKHQSEFSKTGLLAVHFFFPSNMLWFVTDKREKRPKRDRVREIKGWRKTGQKAIWGLLE